MGVKNPSPPNLQWKWGGSKKTSSRWKRRKKNQWTERGKFGGRKIPKIKESLVSKGVTQKETAL